MTDPFLSSSDITTPYVGRFAPSPTGPLHLGSLIAAIASFLEAKKNQGQWLLRMEDLDPPREETGAAQQILDCLQTHGLNWDGKVLWQSQRHDTYQQTVSKLLSEGNAYYCCCSRTDIQQMGGIYDGRCRNNNKVSSKDSAVRITINSDITGFDDQLQGHFSQDLITEIGDFVIKRKDGLFAYQLAVVLDDHSQGVTHILRGSDLLDSTPRQIYLQQLLALSTPNYTHIPVITHSDGQKLSKQTHACALDPKQAALNLRQALHFLNQPPPPTSAVTVHEVLDAALEYWQLKRIPAAQAIDQAVLDNFND